MAAPSSHGRKRPVDDVGETIKRVRREVVTERSLKRKINCSDSSASEGEEPSRGQKRRIREKVEEKVARVLDRFGGALGVPEELVDVKIAAAETDILDDFQRRLEPELHKWGSAKRRRDDVEESIDTTLALEDEVANLKVEAQTLKDLLETTRAEKRAALFANHQQSAELSRWRMLWEDESRQREAAESGRAAAEARLCYAIKGPMMAVSFSPPYVH